MLDADARCVVKIVVKCAGVIEKDLEKISKQVVENLERNTMNIVVEMEDCCGGWDCDRNVLDLEE